MLSCNDDTVVAVIQHGGIKAILAAMQVNRQQAAIQKHCCIALRNFAVLCNEILVDDECIESIRVTMAAHEEDVEIRELCRLALAEVDSTSCLDFNRTMQTADPDTPVEQIKVPEEILHCNDVSTPLDGKNRPDHGMAVLMPDGVDDDRASDKAKSTW